MIGLVCVTAFCAALIPVWLMGGPGGRFLAFIVFFPLFGAIGAWQFGLAGPPQDNHAWQGLLLGFALSWPVASLPLYVRQSLPEKGPRLLMK